MRMDRGHLEFIAALIRNWVPESDRDRAIHAVATDLAHQNPRFDRRRFVKAARGPSMRSEPSAELDAINALLTADPWETWEGDQR